MGPLRLPLSSRTLGNLTGSPIPRALNLPWFPCYLIPPSSLVPRPRTRAWMVGQAGLSLCYASRQLEHAGLILQPFIELG